jgi:N-carbamoyl-L-amino-acid hydrolase
LGGVALAAWGRQEGLRGMIEELSEIGRPAGGSIRSGVSRVGYTDEDIAGRRYVMQKMRETGGVVRVDAAGNIFARREGRERGLAPVLVGSHVDTVPEGGNFDGVLGALAAVEVLRGAGATRRGIEAVVWACEEATFAGASLNGSRAAVGRMGAEELQVVWRGMTKAEAIRRIGGRPEELESARIQPGAYHAYVELHIEQGGRLEKAGVPIGVVEGIVGVDRYEVVVRGEANHAGTTPMAERKDALVAASQVTLAVREIVMSEPGEQVGTVGYLEVKPNAANVVPGEARLLVEMRDLSSAKLEALGAKIRKRVEAIAGESGLRIDMIRRGRNEPALADAGIAGRIEATARGLGLGTMRMASGAGHDAQMMARVMPMGMVFVPSAGGVSHSPREWTEWEDCERGARVLREVVLGLAG